METSFMCFVVSFPPPARIVSLNTLDIQDYTFDNYNVIPEILFRCDLTGCSALLTDPPASHDLAFHWC